jgi:UDP-GlcNAc:undecaprenyl-phosphate GlcNAc-1-phosphate transferase
MFSFDKRKLYDLKCLWYLSCVLFLFMVLPFGRRFFFEHVGRWVYIFLFSFSVSTILTPIVRLIALKLNIVDIPESRKIHDKSTPLLGGVAIVISFIFALMANMILDTKSIVLLIGAIIVALMSLIDDWIGVSAKFKLFVQVSVVLVLIYFGFLIELFPSATPWGYVLNMLITILWIVGITNALNFLDGMDGLAAGISAIIALFLGIVAYQTNQPYMGWIAAAMVGSCLGFLPFNFRPTKPAVIFLGDTGSIFIGFTLSALAVKGEWSNNNPIVSFSAPVLIFWVLIFDMTYITIERIVNGKVKNFRQWIDYVGKDHLHHRLYALLGDRRKAVLFIYFLSATLGISAIALRNARAIDGILLVFQAFLITIIVSLLEYSGRQRP